MMMMMKDFFEELRFFGVAWEKLEIPFLKKPLWESWVRLIAWSGITTCQRANICLVSAI